MFTTDLYSLIARASEVNIDGQKMVGYWFEDEGDEDNQNIIVETEDERMHTFDNAEEVTYGEDTDDGAWVEDSNTGKRMYLTAYTLARTPVKA